MMDLEAQKQLWKATMEHKQKRHIVFIGATILFLWFIWFIQYMTTEQTGLEGVYNTFAQAQASLDKANGKRSRTSVHLMTAEEAKKFYATADEVTIFLIKK